MVLEVGCGGEDRECSGLSWAGLRGGEHGLRRRGEGYGLEEFTSGREGCVGCGGRLDGESKGLYALVAGVAAERRDRGRTVAAFCFCECRGCECRRCDGEAQTDLDRGTAVGALVAVVSAGEERGRLHEEAEGLADVGDGFCVGEGVLTGLATECQLGEFAVSSCGLGWAVDRRWQARNLLCSCREQ